MHTDDLGDGPKENIGPRQKYKSEFPDFDLHHMVPTSRIPISTRANMDEGEDEFNLFPYIGRPHSDYHHIFWNLKIDQLWRMRRRIFAAVFESKEDYANPWWFKFCHLDVGTENVKADFEKDKESRSNKPIYLPNFQENWIGAFGGSDLVTAEEFFKLMMLFMVFGTELLNKDTLFDNGNLNDFIESTPCTSMRLWAFEKCFGQSGTARSLKSKIVSIVDRFDYYSEVIL